MVPSSRRGDGDGLSALAPCAALGAPSAGPAIPGSQTLSRVTPAPAGEGWDSLFRDGQLPSIRDRKHTSSPVHGWSAEPRRGSAPLEGGVQRRAPDSSSSHEECGFGPTAPSLLTPSCKRCPASSSSDCSAPSGGRSASRSPHPGGRCAASCVSRSPSPGSAGGGVGGSPDPFRAATAATPSSGCGGVFVRLPSEKAASVRVWAPTNNGGKTI